MNYIIDIDALKDCLNLLPVSYSDAESVCLTDVINMIDKFPKKDFDKYMCDVNENLEQYYYYKSVYNNIKSGKCLRPLCTECPSEIKNGL